MALIDIWADSKNPGTCRSCHQPIVWAESLSGKRHPFDGAIVPVSVRLDLVGRAIETVDTALTRSHFASCPQANAWRRKAR